MKSEFDLSDPIGMLKRGIKSLRQTKQAAFKDRLEFLARFEKAAAWGDENWTYWDFETAPEELAKLEAARLSYKEVCRRCDLWLEKNEASKPALIRLIENGTRKTILREVSKLIKEGADPNEASLLKDTALGAARYHGFADVFDYLIQNGAVGEKDGFSKLHHAVRYGDLTEVMSLIGSFDVLWQRFGNTSVLHEAVEVQKPDVVVALLDHISETDRLDDEEVLACCSLAVSLGNTETLTPFLRHGIDASIGLDATLEKFDTVLLKALLDQGADVHEISCINLFYENPLRVIDENGQPAIADYIKALLDAGWSIDDLDEFERDQIRFVTEAYRIPKQNIHDPNFLKDASNSTGIKNPEERTLPYYLEMLRTGESSFLARRRMKGLPHGVWTADRFGQSTTRLADGRWVQIGGEHEDFYDPDFVIFNDVVLHAPNGDLRIFFYPESVFPPTDFHSATLVEDSIWIIGGLGYQGKRLLGVTPVYRLCLEDFTITKVDVSGDEPGWISRHSAVVNDSVITVSGGDVYCGAHHKDMAGSYEFDIKTCTWTHRP